MSPRHLIRLSLLLVCLWDATAVSAQPGGLTTEQFATQVAEHLGATRPDIVDKPIHWMFAIDTSGSMDGKSDALGKMVRAFLSSTVVKGDLVSRVRFGSTLKTKDEPTALEFDSLDFSVDKIANGLDSEKASSDTEGETVAAQARNHCHTFIQGSEFGHVRVAILLSDSGANDGKAKGTRGADATTDWSGNVVADRGKSVKLVALYWVGSSESVKSLPSEVVRKVAEKVEEIVQPARPTRDPDGPKRRAFEMVPWILGAITAFSIALTLLWPFSAKVKVSGQSAELKLPWYGAPVKASVNSGGPAFHLTRAGSSGVVDGASVVKFSIEEPHRIWQAPTVKVEGLNDPATGASFQVDVNSAGYDYRGRLRPGKNRLSVQNSAGVVVRDEQIELADSGLRYLLLGIIALACLWLTYFIFGKTYADSLKKPTPGQPAITKWVPRDLVDRSHH